MSSLLVFWVSLMSVSYLFGKPSLLHADLSFLALGSHLCTPMSCSSTILLAIGIPVWSSAPPYLISPSTSELPLTCCQYCLKSETEIRGQGSLGEDGVR